MASLSEGELKAKRVLQIALCSERLEGVKAGLRVFPPAKVVLLYNAEEKVREEVLSDYANKIREVLGVEVEVKSARSARLEDVLEAVRELYLRYDGVFDELAINISEGDKVFACSALTAAFIFGIRAFWTDGRTVYVYPIMRLHYHRALSDAKLAILEALHKLGGRVESLEDLVAATGFDKAELSRHINGAQNSKGLVELGLVEVERGERGRLSVKLTTPAKVLLIGIEAGLKG